MWTLTKEKKLWEKNFFREINGKNFEEKYLKEKSIGIFWVEKFFFYF
jgi:hypothetical protein